MRLHSPLPYFAAALMLPNAAPAMAASVCNPSAELAIPATTEGFYINLLTGVSAPTEGGAPGFDFNPYAAASTAPSGQLRFYWGAAATGNGGVVSSGDRYAVLSPGDSIGPNQLYSRAAITGDVSAWQTGVTRGYLGLRFRNEQSGQINYGWIQLSTSTGLGFPVTVHGWCLDDSGAAVVIPDAIFADTFGS
ncbi:MAG: hypothetical protein JNN30_10480 [Rhodanobacteraceae bacterium]|nr:hypothetical protein [Rhodanobacteraceae bacterium]